MKLARYGKPGKEKPGLIDAQGRLRSLAGVVDDIGPAQLSDAALKKLARIKPETLPLVRGHKVTTSPLPMKPVGPEGSSRRDRDREPAQESV